MKGDAGSSGDLILRGGRILDPARGVDAVGDLIIAKGLVAPGQAGRPAPEVEVLDVTGLIVCPGFIDSHVHLREPGSEHKETIASGTEAAAVGGFTAVAAMPNTQPPPDSAHRLRDLAGRVGKDARVRVHAIGCITLGRAGRELAPLEEMAGAGAVAFSDDGDPVEEEALMRAALEGARRCGRPLFPHEEVRSMTAGGCMHEGEVSSRLGVRGMPAAAEEEMILRDIELVRQTGGRLHIAHISTAGTVELVRAAKAEGLPVTCEALPDHFTLTDEEVARQGPLAKMAPPLRTAVDVAAIRAGLADGTIDTIATDHAPHTVEEKSGPLPEAAFGIVGLETAIGLSITCLVETGLLDLPALVDRWSAAPARVLGLPSGRLATGDPGDVTVIDPSRRWTVDPGRFRSRSRNTPFAGLELVGRAVATVVAGRVAYRAPGLQTVAG